MAVMINHQVMTDFPTLTHILDSERRLVAGSVNNSDSFT